MDNVPFVKVGQCFSDGLEKLFGLCLFQHMAGFRQQIVVEGVGASVLHDDKDLTGSFDGLNQLSDYWVIKVCEDIYLPFYISDLVRLIQPLLLIHLDRNFLSSSLVVTA